MNVNMNSAAEQDRVPAIGDFQFDTEYVPDRDKPGQMKAVERVSWRKLGEPLAPRTGEAISRLMPNVAKRRPAALEWAFIEKAYRAWKAGEDITVDGTPLAAWPGCDRNLAEVLKQRGINTVEQFANIRDIDLSGIPIPDIRKRKELAQSFLVAQSGDSKVAAELASRDERIEKLERMIAEMQAPAPTEANVQRVAPSERPRKERVAA